MRFFIFLLAVLMTFILHANPACQPLTLQGETLHLLTKKPMLILFHNITMNNLYLTSDTLDPSLIAPDQWSLLALTDKEITFSCLESRPGHEQHIPCESALTVCQIKKTPKPPAQTGWLAENKTTSPLPPVANQ